ncbi:MAG: TAT-variant-translocated molybdopterin oxidoreductase [Opitutales bacterium]
MDSKDLSGPRYWKSLDDLSETPAFKEWVEREFPAGASELNGVNRRSFMKVMAASFGLAGLGVAGCRRPEQVILPYSKQPENVIPGIPVYYTTAQPGNRSHTPIIVETHTGRPTKIEGNPSYVANGGATSGFTQASLLDLYDPDRATKSFTGTQRLSQEKLLDFIAQLASEAKQSGGQGFAVLAEPSSSPSRMRLVESLKAQYPSMIWAEYSPLHDAASEQVLTELFDQPARALPRLAETKRILSIDADFLTGDNGIAQSRAFASTRKVKDSKEAKQMSRLYAVESSLTQTGSMADHRLRLSCSQMAAFIAQLSLEILDAAALNPALLASIRKIAATQELDGRWVSECAADLLAYKGQAIVLVGEHLSPAVQSIAVAINQQLAAPIDYVGIPAAEAGIEVIAQKLKTKQIDTLLILGGNPAYDAPADLNWSQLQATAKRSVYFGGAHNETAELASTFIAASHYLESWGDGRAFDGTLVPVQPMIEPLFDTFNELELLARLAAQTETDAYSIVKSTFKLSGGRDFNRFLSDGLLSDSAYGKISVAPSAEKLFKLVAADSVASSAATLSMDALELRFTANAHSYDGRYANNGWMMECPDSITQLTWDNAILISPRLAKELERAQGVQIFPTKKPMNKESGFFEGAKGTLQTNTAQFKRGKEQAVVAKLTVAGKQIEAPIHVLPGLANYTLVLPLGMGRTVVGRVGQGVGFNAYPLRRSTDMGYCLGASIQLTEKVYPLANTQEHWSMEGRAIVRESTASAYSKKPDFATQMGVESHAPANYGKDKDKTLQEKVTNQYRGNSAYKHPSFTKPAPNVKVWEGHEDKFPDVQQWGMAIDLNSCMGCNACVVACQSENNVPIVGKDQVLRGREMHWLRIDRYFSAEKYDQSEIPEDVQVSFMGMMCQHCENAPCEQVCPVNATVHDSQGLNTMAYNRCVGTRYCANNCPYKVRRFNFFDWNKRQIGEFYKGPLGPVDEPELQKMQKNPNVTVRMRGVMEKCTFCTQRIEAAKIEQKRLAGASGAIKIPDGKIKTACQQACATDAISFGDVSDVNSEVSQAKASDRDYSVLGYLNARPRTTYLARLRNPNPKMPDAYKYPYAYSQYKKRYGNAASSQHSKGASHVHDAAHPAH